MGAKADEDDVICEQLAYKDVYVEKLKLIFANLLDNDEECITLDTFEKHMREKRMQAYFHSLDIKVSDAWTMFKLLDKRSDHIIDLNQFIEGCLQLKGSATAIEIESLATEFHWFAEYIDRKFSHLESHIQPAKQSAMDKKCSQLDNRQCHREPHLQPAKQPA